MNNRCYLVVFDAKIHNTNKGNFKIPDDICRLFGIEDQMQIEFIVDDNGTRQLHEKSTTSGEEVRIGTGKYPDGQPIRVTLFNPNYERID